MTNEFPKCITADIDGIHWQLLDSEGKQVQAESKHKTSFGTYLKVISGEPYLSLIPGGTVIADNGKRYSIVIFGFKWVKQNKG